MDLPLLEALEAIGPKTGPDPLENQLDPMGPIASRGVSTSILKDTYSHL